MSETNTTSIDDLPTDSSHGGSIGGNVSLTISETTNHNETNKNMTLDEKTISQIVNGLHQASLSGATTLPSRDIPITTEQLTNDQQIQPNYIPQPQTSHYIDSDLDNINQYYTNETRKNSLDEIYDELQTPLLLAVLYFLFQLPFFKKIIFKYLPFLCHSDGNYNFNGLIFVCGLFGLIYYTLHKTVKHFSKF